MLALVSFGLVLTTNAAAIAWSVPAVLVAIAYPFTKRIISMPQAVLGIAFNFGIVIAFAAVQGSVPAVAWWMWLGNMFWVLAYDTEYAMVDRDDDLKIGIKTSAITFGRFDVAAVMGCYAMTFALIGYAGFRLHMGWPFYAGLAGAVGLAGYHYTLIRGRERMRCFKAFLHNNWVGASIFVGIVLDFLIQTGLGKQ